MQSGEETVQPQSDEDLEEQEEGGLGYLKEDLTEYRKSREIQAQHQADRNLPAEEAIVVLDELLDPQSPQANPEGDFEESKRLLSRINQLYDAERYEPTDSTHVRPAKSQEPVRTTVKTIDTQLSPQEKPKVQLFYKFGYHVDVIQTVLDFNGLIKTESTQKASLIWNPKMNNLEHFSRLQSHQKVNHFPNSVQMGRKDCLNKNIFHMQIRFKKEFSFLPRSYILPQEEPVLLDVASLQSRPSNITDTSRTSTSSSRKQARRVKVYSSPTTSSK